LPDFIPPYPPRLPEPPSPWRRFQLARRNFLEMWEENAFKFEFSGARMFMRRVFVCNSPDSVQFAFSIKNASFERKSSQMRHALEPLIGDGLFISDGETWRKRRRIVAPIVHVSRLPEFAPIMVETAVEARDRWARLQPPSIDALAEMAHLTAEIICRTIFGRQLGHEHAHEIVDGFSNYQKVIDQVDLVSLLGLPDWFPRWYNPAIRKSITRIHGVLDGIIESYRRRERGEEVSVIGRLLDARDQDTGEPLDPEALRNEAAVLFMAGHETTANTLAWAWYLLSQAPEVEAKLHAELDQVLGGRQPGLADLPHLVYTRAVLDETLRLYPPVPILPREALKEENYRGVRIPKGSLILVVPWLLHRHHRLWEQPDHFIPERFLPGGTGAPSKFAYIPFSIGPRICAGMSFGQQEAMLCLATLAQAFRLRLEPGRDIRPVCRLTLRPEGGLQMRIEPRTPLAQQTAPGPAQRQPVGCPLGHG
jgi:cytochrome P450